MRRSLWKSVAKNNVNLKRLKLPGKQAPMGVESSVNIQSLVTSHQSLSKTGGQSIATNYHEIYCKSKEYWKEQFSGQTQSLLCFHHIARVLPSQSFQQRCDWPVILLSKTGRLLKHLNDQIIVCPCLLHGFHSLQIKSDHLLHPGKHAQSRYNCNFQVQEFLFQTRIMRVFKRIPMC